MTEGTGALVAYSALPKIRPVPAGIISYLGQGYPGQTSTDAHRGGQVNGKAAVAAFNVPLFFILPTGGTYKPGMQALVQGCPSEGQAAFGCCRRRLRRGLHLFQPSSGNKDHQRRLGFTSRPYDGLTPPNWTPPPDSGQSTTVTRHAPTTAICGSRPASAATKAANRSAASNFGTWWT